MTAVDRQIIAHVRRMEDSAQIRDAAMVRVALVRAGRLQDVWPDQFSEAFPSSLVANFVDVAARDMAANLSPLPSLDCSAGQMRTNRDLRRAQMKNRIGANYWLHSRLEWQMKFGADQYLSYGFLPFWVEPDHKNRMPLIHVLDPQGCYYDLDMWGRTKRLARVWTQDSQELAALFPDSAAQILRDENGWEYDAGEIDVVMFVDEQFVQIYLPQRKNLLVAAYAHRMPYCPVHIAVRPGLRIDPRGVFDDVLWVQLGHAVMALLTLEAGQKSVQAPIAIPTDVNELTVGPDALLVTDHPEKVGRVGLEVPQAAFALNEQLSQEMRQGAGYPDTRLGQGPAGGSTGRGISALEGGFDSQIKLGQDVLGLALKTATEMSFDMDRIYWPRKRQTISGTISGESFEVTYVPERDIPEDTRVSVTYGFAAGLSPNAAIVTLLQLRGDQLISRNTVRRNLPFDLDPEHEQRAVDVQEIEDGFKQGIAAALQASGQMIAAGPQGAQAAMALFQAASQVIDARRNGGDLAEAFVAAFKPQEPDADEQGGPPDGDADQAGQQPGAGPADIPGVGPNGLPQGVAPGQAGLPPGGRPSVADLSAGFTNNGKAVMGDLIRRRVPTG